MTNYELPQNYGTLDDDTPFNQFFPDNQVPILSIVPTVPKLDAPLCYVIDLQYLTKQQIIGLAKLVHQNWKSECTSLEMAIEYVEKGLPIKCEWFTGVTTTDLSKFMKLVD